MKTLEVYQSGLCHCSICTDIENIEEIERKVNQENPTGLSHGWEHSEEKFVNGFDNPCPCEQKPETHKHYLMVC